MDVLGPMLTAYISEKTDITPKFPWDALGFLFMRLLHVTETATELTMDEVEFTTIAFLDQPHPLISLKSTLFLIDENDFQIDLPYGSWKVNNYSFCLWTFYICFKISTREDEHTYNQCFSEDGANIVKYCRHQRCQHCMLLV
jgi:hypothetical protein